MRRLGDLVWTEDGTVVSARVRVADVRVEPTFRRRVQRTIARLEDDTGSVDATWFGRRFIERRLPVGGEIVVSGRLKHFGRRLTFDNPEFQAVGEDTEVLHAGRIVPVYPLTAGLTAARAAAGDPRGARQGRLRLPGVPARADPQPARGCVPIARAIEEAHYPDSFEGRDAALRRLAFDELLALQLGMVARRRQRAREAAPLDRGRRAIGRGHPRLDRRLIDREDRAADRAHRRPGDRDDARSVATSPARRRCSACSRATSGSGKTAVAAFALATAARAGLQGALLAPTDLLARQHLETLGGLLEGLGLGVTLLTGSLPADTKAKATEAIRSGQASVVVGTHALIQESVSFRDLGLVVIDEQHRFGVDQRGQLEAKAGGRVPHVLLMTATPIPRTLGQVLYADLDVSDLRTPPEGRVPIRTGIRRAERAGRHVAEGA